MYTYIKKYRNEYIKKYIYKNENYTNNNNVAEFEILDTFLLNPHYLCKNFKMLFTG